MRKNILLLFTLILISSVAFAQPLAITPTSSADRMKGFEQRKVLNEKSLVNNLNFRNVGPTTMSGRVVDLEGNPDNPAEFYVAYASGGLWKTNNNGQSFEPIFDNEAVMTIGDIAVDWKNNIVWVGTGENNSSRSSYAGVGMYKSTDGGKNWQHLGLEDTHHIGRVALHPTNPNVAWVSAIGHLYSSNAERGVYKTTDGGKSWKKTLFLNENTGAIDLTINPKNPKELYASMWHRERSAWNFVESGEESGIYKSTDGGDNWKLISDKKSGFPQGKGNGRIGLAVFPKNPNIVYAIIDNQAKRPDKKKKEEEASKLTKDKMKDITKDDFLALSDDALNEYLDDESFPEKYNAKQLKEDLQKGAFEVKDIFLFTHNGNDDLFDTEVTGAEVYRSDDAGKTWKKTNTDYIDGLYYTYGYYFGQIFVAPDNDQKIVIMGVPVIRSEDGGKTFKSIDAGNVHADHHALWFNPKNSDHYILGNDGGINITYDNGKTWFKGNSLPVGQFYAVTYDMEKPYNVYGGLQDNGVWYGPSTNNFDFNFGIFDGGDGFKFLMGGDGMQVQVDTRDNNIVYSGFQFGSYFRINKTTGERKYLQMPRKLGEEQLRFNWESPIHLSRHNQDIIYFGSHKFHRSLNQGDDWETLSGDLTRGKLHDGDIPFGTLSTIEESLKRFGLIYVGSDDGLAHVSKDGGYSWEKIADKMDLWCVGVIPSAHEEATVYAAFNGYRNDHFGAYLYASTDYGKTWTTIGTDLPAEPINVIREDPVNADLLYVGTDYGLYISLDKGKKFMHANGTMPGVAIHDLQIHPRENELIVGTHGRSIYVGDIKPLQKMTEEYLAKNLVVNPLEGITHNPSWGKMRNSFVEAREQKFLIQYYAKSAGEAKISIKTAGGLVIHEMTSKAEVGLNEVAYDLSIDSEIQKKYEKELTEKGDKTPVIIEVADDKKLYIQPGQYTVEISQNGNTTSETFEVKARKKKSRRNVVPQGTVSPDEFEEWYEDMGFEEVKK